ncbi:MAG: MFS transporter [Micromonosporaceae bacterium]
METTRGAARPRLVTPGFATVILAGLAYFFTVGVLVPAVPRYVAGPLAGGDAAVGISFGAFTLSALLLRPWAGRLADRYGRRPMMIGGAAVAAVSLLGYAFAGSVPTLVALRLLTGVGEACFWVGFVAAAADLAPPERRGEAMSYSSLSLYVGLALGPPAGEWLVDAFGYTTTWLVGAGVLIAGVALALSAPETNPSAAEQQGRPPLIHRGALVPAGLLLAVVWGMAGLFAFAALYARELGMSDAGWLLFGFAGVVVLIRLFGARLPDRLGPSRATIAALSLATAGLATIGLWRTAAGLAVGAVVLAVGVALATPAIFALAMAGTRGSERGAVSGTLGISLDLGLGLGPISLGAVAALADRGTAFLVAAAVAATGLALALGSARHRATRPAAVPPR